MRVSRISSVRNKALFFVVCVSFFIGFLGISTEKVYGTAEESIPMYRLYNKNNGEHFYTKALNEKNSLVGLGWKYEGIGWYAPKEGTPVYRVYNPNAGDHHYTLNVAEKNNLLKLGWQYEGIGWYSSTEKEVPLYRSYNPNAKAGSHNYTILLAEHQKLVSVGWKDEGVAWYGVQTKESAGNTENLTTADQIAASIFAKVNEIRVEKGTTLFSTEAKLQQAANLRANEIHTKYLGNHLRPDGRAWKTVFDDIGYDTTQSVFGENICKVYLRGRSTADVVMAMVDGWKNSQGHYENMINPLFQSSAIGVYIDENEGYAYGVELFSSK